MGESDSALGTEGVFPDGPAGRQLRKASFEPEGASAEFEVEVQNDGKSEATFLLNGFEGDEEGWKVEAFQSAADRWPAIKNDGYSTGPDRRRRQNAADRSIARDQRQRRFALSHQT